MNRYKEILDSIQMEYCWIDTNCSYSGVHLLELICRLSISITEEVYRINSNSLEIYLNDHLKIISYPKESSIEIFKILNIPLEILFEYFKDDKNRIYLHQTRFDRLQNILKKELRKHKINLYLNNE